MTRSTIGMALAPWNVLGAGKIRTDAEEERRRQTGEKGASAWLKRTESQANEPYRPRRTYRIRP